VTKPIRLLLVADDPRMRQGLMMRLSSEPDFEVAGVTTSGEDALAQAELLLPDVVLLDITMPWPETHRALRALLSGDVACRVVLVSLADDEGTRQRAFDAGARAFVTKQEGSDVLLRVIRQIASGHCQEVLAE
jgi:DNA-binding NarL/FixJ family response regulator